MYESNRRSINENENGGAVMFDKIEDNVTLEQIKKEYSEVVDIFPALHKYKKEHSTANLQKLCVELSDFCAAIYSSTRNDEERAIYKRMVEKLNK